MTTLATRLSAVVSAIGADVKDINGRIGSLGDLTGSQTVSLVAAIEEIRGIAVTGATSINDSLTSGNANTWSVDKISSEISAAINAVVDGAPTAFDTLKEIADFIASDETAVAGILTALDNRVRFDASQTLTGPQKSQACTNIGAVSLVDAGDISADLGAIYNTAKA